jgi:hypothetical protein
MLVISDFASATNKIFDLIFSFRGTEFRGACIKLFREKKIYYKTKYPPNKASEAEHNIFVIKNILYRLLKSELSKDWVKFLPKVTESLNNSPLERLGFLTPNDVSTVADTVLVEQALKANNIRRPQIPTFQQQTSNQETYEKSSKNFQVDDYCYLNFPPETFEKSFYAGVQLFSLSAHCNFYCTRKEARLLSCLCLPARNTPSEKLNFPESLAN